MKSHSILFLIILFVLTNMLRVDAQWVRQYPLDKLEHVNDIALHADGHGFAVGGDDLILRLDPGIKKWELLLGWDKNWTLEAVDYLNGTAFVAAGGQGVITSEDNGAHWTQLSGAPSGIHAIHIVSPTDIVVIADGGVHRWSNNTWTSLNLPVTSGVSGGFILDDQHIWCFTAGSSPVIYSTANGGGMWSSSTQVARPDVVMFYDTQYGIALDGRMVYQSKNGGLQWSLVSNNAIHNSVNDITFGASPNVLMAATFNAVPTISLDSGRTWTQKPMGLINQRNYSIASISDEDFWVGNDLSSVAFTTDAGTSWIETSGPGRRIMNDVFFLNRNEGFAVGSEGTLLRTQNGGAQWEDISFGETRQFISIYGLSANDMWLGASQRIYHSSDQGETWEQKAAFLGVNVQDILAISPTLVLAASTNGLILRTEDGGTTWDTVFQTNGQIRSLARIDNMRYMATGFNGLILRSTDQGATWNPIAAPEAGLQYEQTQFIGDEGWLVTSSFKKTMWHTPNAGDTWEPITLPIDRFWDGVYFITPDTGIIVGRSSAEGRAYITFNGGTNWQSGYITDYPLYGVTGLPNPNGSAWIFGFGSDIEILPYCTELPVISDLQGNTVPCENDTIEYSITSLNVDQYFWLFPSGWQIIGNPNNDTVHVKVGRNAGTISVTGLNSCGFSSPVSIGAGPILIPRLLNLTGDPTPCESELLTYSVTGQDISDYTWTFPDSTWDVFGAEHNNSIQVFVGETSGIISVTGTNVCGSATLQLPAATELRPRMHGVSGESGPCRFDLATYIANQEYADAISWTYPADWEVVGASDEPTIEFIVGAEAGVVTATGINPCGMSAIAETPVTPIVPPDIVVLVNDNQLSLSADGLAYQWYLDGAQIPGANFATYTATVSGDYFAIMTVENGCITISDTVNVIISATGHLGEKPMFNLYPSPATNLLHITGIEGQAEYRILDLHGRHLIWGLCNGEPISLTGLDAGMYLMSVSTKDRRSIQRFIKIAQ